MIRYLVLFLLLPGLAWAQCPTVPSACPSPTYNALTVGPGLLKATGNETIGGTLAVTGAVTFTVPPTVANGGTGLSSGTSGGILGFTSTTALASSVLLTQNGLVIGGGAGATPTAITAGTNGQIPVGATGAAPVMRTLGGDVTAVTAGGLVTVNASSLGGATFASPGPIGSTSASTGAFTTLSATSTVSGAGFTAWAASPPPIGGTVAAAGTFTSLAATAAAITGGSMTVNSANYSPTSNYPGTSANAAFLSVLGSSGTPDTTNNAVAIFQHWGGSSSANLNPALYASAIKTANGSNQRVEAGFFEAQDNVGWSGVGGVSFVEGVRAHGTLGASTTLGSAYGVEGSAIEPVGATHTFLIGVEGEVINNSVDASATVSSSAFSAAILATSDGTKKTSAGFIINPNTPAVSEFQYGYYVPAGASNTPVVVAGFETDAAAQYGLVIKGPPSTGAILIPNNSAINAQNAANNAALNIAFLNSSNQLVLGNGTTAGVLIGGAASIDQIMGSGTFAPSLGITSGFLRLPFTNATSGAGGIPTGTPATLTDGPACIYNTVTSVLNCYNPTAGLWTKVQFTSGAG